MDGEPAANATGTLIEARRNLETIATKEEQVIERSYDLHNLIREVNELEIEMGEEETEDDILFIASFSNLLCPKISKLNGLRLAP